MGTLGDAPDLLFTTHQVRNQVPASVGFNGYTCDPLVSSIIETHAPWAHAQCADLGALVGDPEVQELARQANRHLPELRTHDALGYRLDTVEFHPAYHECMRLGFGHGVHSLAWTAEQPGGHVARAALSYLWNQIENGTACPTGMAYAALPALRAEGVPEQWADKAVACDYDPRQVPMSEKSGVTIGYAMTEKHAVSDLRATATTAVPLGAWGTGQMFRITGHKWFCSAPMSDGFFTLALNGVGLSCFFLPRILPDGKRNRIHFQRLKDKCGNRSNASSEVEFAEALGYLVGRDGHGISTILSSAHLTRLDFAVGSAGLQRRAIALALHHAEHRRSFGLPLIEHAAMRRILDDLILEWQGATRLAFRLAEAADSSDESEQLLLRVLTPIAKFWNCKRVSLVVEEALECIGGNGYVEEHPMARLYREAPLNSIWEGTSNMMTMDVNRVLDREPKVYRVLLDEIRLAAGAHPELDRTIAVLERFEPTSRERPNGRALSTLLALALQAALTCRHAPEAVAGAYCDTRLGERQLPGFGAVDFSRAQSEAIMAAFLDR